MKNPQLYAEIDDGSLPDQQVSMDAVIQLALWEDIGSGDVSSQAIIPDTASLAHRCAVKQDGIIAGLSVMQKVAAAVDSRIECELFAADGDEVRAGTLLAALRGPARSVLTAERTALNFLQRMSGIATAARAFVQAVEGTGAVILDTRKTAPGLRFFDKLAVRLGGAQNHRFGLYDMIMIKDNHIVAAGGIRQAIEQAAGFRRQSGRELPIEVEVASLDQLREVLSLPVDRIMLDNMSLTGMREAVALVGGKVELEASGNVSLQTVRGIAETGVDFISVGSLTHSVIALDIHLLSAAD